jgi:hypothetical protein
MIISVKGKNESIGKREIKYIINFFGKLLLGRQLGKFVSVEVLFLKLEDNLLGLCGPVDFDYKNHREFEILIDNRQNKKNQILTLAHEMCHLKQYARGELKNYSDDIYKWMGKTVRIPNDKYKNMPWEKEANLSEGYLYDFYKQHLKNNNIKF